MEPVSRKPDQPRQDQRRPLSPLVRAIMPSPRKLFAMSAFFVVSSGFIGYKAWDAYSAPKQEPKIAVVTPASLSHDSESHFVQFVDSTEAKAKLNVQARMRGVQVAVCRPPVEASQVSDLIQKARSPCKVVVSASHLDSQVQAVQAGIDLDKRTAITLPLSMLILAIPGALGSAFFGFILRRVLPKPREEIPAASS